jgi:hypothetical protein
MIISPFHNYKPPANPGPPPKTIIDTLFKARSKRDLSKRELAFLDFVGGPERPISLREFRKIWSSMTEREQHDIKMAYVREK